MVTLSEKIGRLKHKFGTLISDPVEHRGEMTVTLHDCKEVVAVCDFAKRHLGFDYLIDISSIDNYGSDPRWTLVYHLRSLETAQEWRLLTHVSEEKSEVPSVLPVWRTANWHEREIYDMMGIRFEGHPDLRRILMWEGYSYYPLRKDFPLAGKPTELPGIAFTRPAPLEGGPFVTLPSSAGAINREPRVRTVEG